MINRDNYEEYLLLYLDGELPAVERQAVESFLQANPDLRPELELLQQTLLQPEAEIRFDNKSVLYREESGIHPGNYQEFFLMYVDAELDAAGNASVETFVLQHPELQEEFTLLKNTVLPQEEMVFAHKASLYRREERRPVLISIRWASLAAAIMIGLIALLVFYTGNQPEPVAGKTPPSPEARPADTDMPARQLPQAVEENNRLAAGSTRTGTPRNLPEQVVQQVSRKETPADAVPPAQQQQLAVIETSPQIVEPALVPTGNAASTSEGETKALFANETAPQETSYVQPAVYTEELEPEKENNLYVGALQINSDKVRGLFRKASRFLSSKVKTTDEDGDGKLRIANMEVNKIK